MINRKLPPHPPSSVHPGGGDKRNDTERHLMNNRGMTHSLLTKLSQENYFSAWLIFGLDMVISACSSLMVLLLRNLFTFSSFSLAFSAWWLLGSAVTSAVMFLALHTDQSIVWHSTLRKIGKLGFAACGKSLLMGVLSFLFVRMSGALCWFGCRFWISCSLSWLWYWNVSLVAVYEMICGRISQRNSIQRILSLRNQRKIDVTGRKVEELQAL